MTVMYFARAGELTPALVLFEPVVNSRVIIAPGYIANQQIRTGRKLYEIHKVKNEWVRKPNGLCCAGLELSNSKDTFDTRLQVEVL